MAKGPKKSVADKAAKPKASKASKVAAAPRKAAAEKPAAPVETATSGKAKAAKTAKPAGQSAVKKAAAPRKAPAKPVSGSTPASGKRADVATVTPEQRYRMIQDAAYFIAERNGFVGDNHAYWLEAEQAIDAKLAAR